MITTRITFREFHILISLWEGVIYSEGRRVAGGPLTRERKAARGWRMCASCFASEQIARNRLISFANGEPGAETVPFPVGPCTSGPFCPQFQHSRFLVRRILPVVSSASRSWEAKGEKRACWQDMNSKHKYISFRAGRTLGIFASYRGEKLGGPRAVNHIAPRLCDLSHRRVGTFKIFRPAKKRYTWSYSKSTRRYENVWDIDVPFE